MLKRSNLSDQIIAILRKEILRAFEPGQRMPAIRDMADRFNVSKNTLREALSALVHENLVERRPGSGMYVSDRIKGRHVAVLAERDISDPHTSYFYRRAPQLVVRFLRAHDVPVRLYAGHIPAGDDSPRPLTCTEFLKSVEGHQLSGVVAFAPENTFPQWLEPLRTQHVPVVGMSEAYDYGVIFDYRGLVPMGVEYLLRHSRRRIAMIEHHWTPDRRTVYLEAFQSAMGAVGVDINPNWIRRSLNPCSPGAGWEDFRAIWAEGREKPDGLLVCDDNLFPSIAMAILQMGIRVPEDLQVATHFNKGSGMINPFPVGKLEFDPEACARAMGEMLLKLMHEEPVETRRVILPCELVETDGQIHSRTALHAENGLE